MVAIFDWLEHSALAAWIKDGAVWPEVQAGTKPESVLSDHFESHIRPVLAQQCFACHTNSKSGGLRLDSVDEGLHRYLRRSLRSRCKPYYGLAIACEPPEHRLSRAGSFRRTIAANFPEPV